MPQEPFRTTNPTDATRAGSRPSDSAPATVPAALTVPGYKLVKEIGRGGMAVVYEAIDTMFDRAVAIKTPIPGRPFDADTVRRFETEAHITARLQHPAVPPVFTVGRFHDGRPYMVMKLIHGRHLGELLKQRPSPAHGLPQALAAFEQVCHAVGFAHAKGVLHRDLKPSNIMIGAFGEVQVTDWGLAKEIVGSEWLGDNTERIATPDAQETQAGRALGTPAYMAPEQARGEWSRVGPWSDVFALGGILADILTGKPPFVGETALNTLVLAGSGSVSDVFARLDATGADSQLLALTKKCLAPDPQHRYADGKALADAVAVYRAGVEARLRKAEAERAASAAKEQESRLRAEAEAAAKQAAEERADEADRRARAERAGAEAQRKARRTQLLLAVAVALLLSGAGAFAWWRESQAGERIAERRAQQARAEAERAAAEQRDRDAARAALKLAVELRTQRKFREAAAAIAQAEKHAASLEDVLPDVKREKADIAFARDLDAVRARRWAWVPNPNGDGGRFDTASIPDAYSAAFAARGLHITRDNPEVLAKRIGDSAIRADLLRSLDDWALLIEEKDPTTADRILKVAFLAGPPGDLATKLRDPAVRRDDAQLNKLIANAADVAESIPATLFVNTLFEQKRKGNAHVLLAIAQSKHPLDFDITLALALWHHAQAPRRVPQEQIGAHLLKAVGHYRAARALRPDHPTVLTNLGFLLIDLREPADAAAVLKEAVKFHPNDHDAHFQLGNALQALNDLTGAEAAYRETIRLSPNFGTAYNNLAAILMRQNRGNEALPEFQRAVELSPNDPLIRVNLGTLLVAARRTDDAIGHFKRAIALAPKLATAHYGLGTALELKKDMPAALAAYREAIKLDPKRYADLAKKLPPDEK